MQIHLEKKFSSYVFLHITEAIEVTQEINCTGIIPLEALHVHLPKRPHFQKDCPGDGDEENIEPQHKIIGTVTHTMEAQTPVTDKSLSDFMYKNVKQTEKLKKKYTATKSKLKRTKQELDEVRSKKHESVHATSENTMPKKTVSFAKNTMPKKASTKTKPSTKGVARSKSSKSLTTTTTTTTSLNPKVKVKTEPVSAIETDDSSDDDGGAGTENVTEIDTEESSSYSLTDSDSDE